MVPNIDSWWMPLFNTSTETLWPLLDASIQPLQPTLAQHLCSKPPSNPSGRRSLDVSIRRVCQPDASVRCSAHPTSSSDARPTPTSDACLDSPACLMITERLHHLLEIALVGRLDNSAVSSASAKLAFKSNEEIELQVRSIPLGEVIPESEPVLLVKIDVQGWEHHVLKGAVKLLSREVGKAPYLIYEEDEWLLQASNSNSKEIREFHHCWVSSLHPAWYRRKLHQEQLIVD